MYLIITIDVETPQTPLRQGLCQMPLLDPIVDSEHYGYSYILRVLKKFHVKGVFFVNVYETSLWDETLLRRACGDIHAAGSEIGLHTHPEWCYDSSRHNMWQYSLDEQTQIIYDGLELIKKWVPGYRTINHRAGAYGINENTFEALRTNDVMVDSSMFYRHPNCKIAWNRNRSVTRNGVVEIPVNLFERQITESFANLTVRSRRALVKTDVNWASLDELLFFVDEAKKHHIRSMTLFMHSYSFIRFSKDFAQFEPDYAAMEKFERFLSVVANDPDVNIVKMRDLYNACQEKSDDLFGSDYIPVYTHKVTLRNKVWQALRSRIKKHGKCAA